MLIRCLQICLHRRFQPALELYSQLDEAQMAQTPPVKLPETLPGAAFDLDESFAELPTTALPSG